MDREAFVRWALGDMRTLEERYTAELLVEEGVRRWNTQCRLPEREPFEERLESTRRRDSSGGLDWASDYSLSDRRLKQSLNKKSDGTFVGMSEIIATPVPCKNRVYVAIGRDPEHGRGRGALWCIDVAKTGDISQTGKIWCYQGLDRTLSTVSIADVGGRLHCLDAETGEVHWIYDTQAGSWSSTLVADGKIYLPSVEHLWVLAAGKEKKVLSQINLGAPM